MSHPPIYFLRHGETAWNKERRIQGQINTPLNATGHIQAQNMARKLVEILPDHSGFTFHVSPQLRARETMNHVLEAYGLPIEHSVADERLREINFGIWEGKHWPELNAAGIDPGANPEVYHDWMPENGESYASTTERVRAWLDSLAGPAVTVAHGGISRIVRGVVLGLEKHEVVRQKVPQDKFYRLASGTIEWFDASVTDA